MQNKILKIAIIFFQCLNLYALPITPEELNIDPNHPIVFPHISKTVADHLSDLELSPDQEKLLAIIYEKMLCEKTRSFYNSNLGFIAKRFIDLDTAQEIFNTCSKHVHLQNDDLKLFENVKNNVWIPDMFGSSHGLTHAIVTKYQTTYLNACEKFASKR